MQGIKIVSGSSGTDSPISEAGARQLTERYFLSLEEGAGNFDVRVAKLEVGGISQDHAHPWEQANYILTGQARLVLDGQPYQMAAGDFAFIPGNVRHYFVNTGDGELALLAIRGPRADAE